MHDWLGALSASTFKHHSISEDNRLDRFWDSGLAHMAVEELSAQILEDHICSDALRQQLIQFTANEFQLRGRLISIHVARNLIYEAFVVGHGNVSFRVQRLIFNSQSLQHHDCTAHVAAGVFSN